MKVDCRVMEFEDELDEKESLIEFNKQRKKTILQIRNEDKTLREIYAERSKRRMSEAGKIGGERAGRGRSIENRGPLNLADPYAKEIGDTRDKVAETIGVNRNTLETIRVIGELADNGKTEKEIAIEKKQTPVTPVKVSDVPKEVVLLRFPEYFGN